MSSIPSTSGHPTGSDPSHAAPSTANGAIASRRATAIPPVEFTRVPWRRVGLFMLLSYGLFIPFAAPFWFLPGGIAHPAYSTVIGLGMWAPAIASLIMAKAVERTSWRTRVGLRFRGRWRRLLVWMPLALVVMMAVHALSALVMVLRGVPGDLTGATWLAIMQQQMTAATGLPTSPLTVIGITALVAAAGLVVTFFLTLGEEIGWRGWLWPALRPLGRFRAALVGGVIWSLWHLPIVLIGHSYTGSPRWLAVLAFLLPCVAMTLLFGALTDRALGNPLPATVAHATMNSQLGLVLSLVGTTQTGAAMSLVIDTPMGLTGAAVMLLAGTLIGLHRRGTSARQPRARSLAG